MENLTYQDELQIQALLDGELPPDEARRVRQCIDADPHWRACHESLAAVRGLLQEAELPRSVPDAHEFYWATIARRIELAERRDAAEAPPKGLPLPGWIRRLRPLAWSAGLTAALASLVLLLTGPGERLALFRSAHLGTNHDIEITSGDVNSIAFRSEAEGVSVVWVQTRLDN